MTGGAPSRAHAIFSWNLDNCPVPRRLADADIAWLYENVPVGTKVYIY